MKNSLLVYIVSYERIEYTIGTIKSIHSVLPPNSQIIVCDNGSTDGTREWLEENQEKYNLGIILPEENLRVGGACKMLTRHFQPTDFDYILVLDNDCWIVPDSSWFDNCMEIFAMDPKRCSLGLLREKEAGKFSIRGIQDPNYKNVKIHKSQEYFDTVYYAAARLDKFDVWHKTMSNWSHQFIADKIGRHYNGLGYTATKLHPGYVIDISEFDFDNANHTEYYKWFFNKEKSKELFDRKLNDVPKNKEEIIRSIFPDEVCDLIYKK